MRLIFIIFYIVILSGCESAHNREIRLKAEQAARAQAALEQSMRDQVGEIRKQCSSKMKKKYPQVFETKLVNKVIYTGDKVTGSERVCFPRTMYTDAWCFDEPTSEPVYNTVAVQEEVDVNSETRQKATSECTCERTKRTPLTEYTGCK